MYIDSATSQGKYTRHLLRENYRKDGKVKHRTIANLSQCSPEEIEAMKLALKHKNDLGALCSLADDVTLQQGLSVGAVWLAYDMAKQLGIVDALGPTQEGKRALWQVIARVIDQGSRLSAVRLAGRHAACDILGLDVFDEDLDTGIAEWSRPNGGYFINLDTMDGCAKKVVRMAADAGVKLTAAGATFPYKKDPRDRNIRIAPSLPSVDEIRQAMELVSVCIKLASIDKLR